MSKAPLGAQPPNMLGSPTATVTVEEFADFQCGACANVHPVLKNVQSVYGSNIKFIFRHFPLQMHRNAYDAAVAAEAAGLQGKFWDMQNLIFSNQQSWAGASDVRTIFVGYAERLGLDVEKFKNDILGTVTKNRVDADMQRGRALNITSTPTVYVNGVAVPYDQMTLEGMKRIIDAELQKTKQGQTNSTNAVPVANTTNSSKKDSKKP
jgi:protein-disulfide isomerase